MTRRTSRRDLKAGGRQDLPPALRAELASLGLM